MTRPMTGPPGGFTDRARLNYALLGKQITYEQYQEFGNALTKAFTAKPKHLTHVECAAHEWQAVADRLEHEADVNCGYETPDDTLDHRAEVWHRFAHTTHALEEA